MAVWPGSLNSDYRIIGVFASAAAYVADVGSSYTAREGDAFYNTTTNQLNLYNGSSWVAVGGAVMPLSLDGSAQVGAKITNATAIEIEATAPSANLLILDSNGTATADVLDISQAGGATHLINLTQAGTGKDIDGTGSTWSVSKAGAGIFNSLQLSDNLNANFGTSSDMTISFNDGAPGTAGNGMLIQGTAADEQVQFGDATYGLDVWFVGDTATTNFMKWDQNGGADSVGALVLDNADIDLGDGDIIRFGDSQDVTVGYASSGDVFSILHDDGVVALGVDGGGFDMYWYTETAGNWVYFDEDNEQVDFVEVDLTLDDDSMIELGGGTDVTMQFDGTDFNILAAAADTPLKLGGTTYGFDLTYYFETTGTITTDYDTQTLTLDACDLALGDDDYILLGDSATAGGTSDGTIRWDNTSGNIEIIGNIDVTGNLTVSGAFDIGNFVFGDDEELRFGNSNDFVFQYDSSSANMAIDAAAANDAIDIGSTTNTDLVLHGGTGGRDATWDSSANSLIFADNALLVFGTGSDITMLYDSDSFNITGSGLAMEIGADTAPLDITIFGTTTGDYIKFQKAGNTNGELEFEDCSILMKDDTPIRFGDSAAEGTIASDGSDIVCTGNFNFGIDATGVDVTFYGDTTTVLAQWDYSEDALTFQDAAYIKLGTGNDLIMSATGTTITYTMAAGSAWNISDTDDASSKITFGVTGGTHGMDVQFNTVAAGEDIIFDAAGKTLTFDNVDIVLSDDDIIAFGDSSDFTIAYDSTATALVFSGAASNSAIYFGDATSLDVIIHGGTSTDTVTFDTSEPHCTFNGFDLRLDDDDYLQFGDDQDITIRWDQTQLVVHATTADSAIHFGDETTMDVVMVGATTSQTVTFDGSAESVDINGWDVNIQDDDILQFGDANDITMTWDQTKLVISGAASDNAIHFGDETSLDVVFAGATSTNIVTFDASTETVEVNGWDLHINDDDILQFGDSDDITMTWDQTKLVISGAASDNAIHFGDATSLDVVFAGATSTNTVTFDGSAEAIVVDGWDLNLKDDDILQFGDGPDITMTWDQTQLNVEAGTADVAMRFGYTTNLDLEIYGDATGNNVKFDTSAELCTFTAYGLTMATTSVITASSAATDFGGLVIPQHASSSPSGTPGTGAIYYEIDASKLWVHKGGGSWVGTVLS